MNGHREPPPTWWEILEPFVVNGIIILMVLSLVAGGVAAWIAQTSQ